MDADEKKPFTAHFEITTRCDSCKQTYHGQASISVGFMGFLGREKAQKKLEEKVAQVLTENYGVGVQLCPHCQHIQAWNIEETADVYSRWWSPGIAALVISIFYVITSMASGFDPGAPDVWLNLFKLVVIPVFVIYLVNLIARLVFRGYYAVKYNASESFMPEISIVNQQRFRYN